MKIIQREILSNFVNKAKTKTVIYVLLPLLVFVNALRATFSNNLIVCVRQMKQSADWRSGNTVLSDFSVGKQTLLQVDSDTRSDSPNRIENKIISKEPHERSKVEEKNKKKV